MKTKMLIASMAIALISSVSFANNLVEKNVLGRSFCQNNNGHLTGWSFAKDGIAYNINSLAGMPSPFSFFQVEYIVGTDQFRINEYSTNSKELIRQGKYLYKYDLALDALRSGNVVLTAKQCGN